jgi:hypothetical protein
MTCEIVISKGAVFAVWGVASTQDVDRIIALAKANYEQFGEPVTYITRVPVNAPPPNASVRHHINDVLPSAMKYCSTYHVVIEGDGFVAALKRSVLIGITQLTQRRGTFFVHAHVDEAVRAVDKSAQSNVKELLRLASEQGLLQSNGRADAPPSSYRCPPNSFRAPQPTSPSTCPAALKPYPGALQVLRHLSLGQRD